LDFNNGAVHLREEAVPETTRTGITVTGRLLDMRGIRAELEDYALRHGA
jgi:hypothetical protein